MAKKISADTSTSTTSDKKEITGTDITIAGVTKRGMDVAVTSQFGSLLSGVDFDAVNVSYPTTTTETYEFYLGGLAGAVQTTLTITYTDTTKDFIDNVVRS